MARRISPSNRRRKLPRVMPRKRRLEEGTIIVKEEPRLCEERMRAQIEESKSSTGSVVRRASLQAPGGNARGLKLPAFGGRDCLMLEREGDLVSGDCAFAKN